MHESIPVRYYPQKDDVEDADEDTSFHHSQGEMRAQIGMQR
jgi:hypothetical protein